MATSDIDNSDPPNTNVVLTADVGETDLHPDEALALAKSLHDSAYRAMSERSAASSS